MPMYNCTKCFNNDWRFEKLPDRFVRATCQFCGYEVEWERKVKVPPPKPVKSKINQYNECRKCNGKLESKNAKITAKKLKRKYFYSQFYRCVDCKTIYYFPKDQVPTTQLGILDKTNLLNN